MLRRVLLLALAAASFQASFPAAAHNDRLDEYGCHKDRVRGGYHCHRGALKGEAFPSKDVMLRELHRRERQSSSSGR